MEDTSIQAKLWQFLKELNPVERTDLHCSVMAFPDGYSIQLVAPGKMLNVNLSMETHQYLSSDCAVIATGEVQA